VMGFFKIRSQKLFVQDWLQTTIFLIAAFGVARITGVSHQCPAPFYSLTTWLLVTPLSQSGWLKKLLGSDIIVFYLSVFANESSWNTFHLTSSTVLSSSFQEQHLDWCVSWVTQ
jgi:hypothetical protein